VFRPLYEQPYDKQGYDGAKRSEDDDMPWVKHQNYSSEAIGCTDQFNYHNGCTDQFNYHKSYKISKSWRTGCELI
jgi:hypothetical protein